MTYTPRPGQPADAYGQQPGYPPPPGYTQQMPLQSPYAAPMQPKKRVPLALIIAIAVTAAVCGFGGMAIGSSGNSNASASSPTPGPTVTVTATVQAAAITATPTATKTTAPPKATAPPKPASNVVMTFKGSGIKNSPKFTTGDDWTISYTYDCSHDGGEGNFIVEIYTDGEMDFGPGGVNELGRKGSDSSPVYGDAGQHYLSVNSECSWTVKVTTNS